MRTTTAFIDSSVANRFTCFRTSSASAPPSIPMPPFTRSTPTRGPPAVMRGDSPFTTL
jgi:hypothetical protein